MWKPATEITSVIAKSQLEPLSLHPLKARISPSSSLWERCIFLSFLFWCENDLKDVYDLGIPVQKTTKLSIVDLSKGRARTVSIN